MLAPSPSQQDRPLHGLWSLWDIMQKFSAEYLISVGQKLRACEEMIEGKQPLNDEQAAWVKDTLHHIYIACHGLGLPVAFGLLGKVLNDPPQTARELGLITEAVKSELGSRLFLFVPPHRARFYEYPDLLSLPTRRKFPKAFSELTAAANCYSAGLNTACVFHCMRGLEHGLGALASNVGIVWSKEQWHSIIELVESKIETDRKTLPRGIPKDERLNFLSLVAKEFFYFKDGWRNYVSHNRVSYEEPQALQTLEHVRSFTEHIAKELKEEH